MSWSCFSDNLGVDECANATSAGCQHICQNTILAYHCACRDGFSLDANGKTCRGKDTILAVCNCIINITMRYVQILVSSDLSMEMAQALQ